MSNLDIRERLNWDIVDREGRRRRFELIRYLSVVDRSSGLEGYGWLAVCGEHQIKAHELSDLKEAILKEYGGQEAHRPLNG